MDLYNEGEELWLRKELTLPKDFDELLKAGDIEVLKAVYDKCELTAYDGNSVCTLHFITGCT